MKVLFKFLMIFFFWVQLGSAQELTKTHVVKKGETVYQISKLYNVTINDIFKLNPDSKKVIYIDDVLIISKSIEESNNTSRSTNNTTTSTYLVQRGDTKYGLSRKFGVTITELEARNPHIVSGLQANHILQINNNSYTQNVTPRNQLQETSLEDKQQKITNYKSHLVLKGETLWGISKKYNVNLNELKQANSTINPRTLQIGITLKVPVELDNTNSITINNSNTPPSTYRVKKGDSKYSISRKFNVSIADLEASNPQIVKMLSYGITIDIPSSENQNSVVSEIQEPKENISETTETETIEDVTIIPQEEKGDYTDLRLSISKAEKNKLLIIVPFTEIEFKDYEEKSIDFSSISDQDIKQNLEFYRGAKMAIDSARSLGLNFEITILKAESNFNFSENQEAEILKTYNGILLPFYKGKTEDIAKMVLDKKIPVVTTHTEATNNNLSNLFEALPSINLQRLKMLDYLNNKNENIIVINDKDRKESKDFIATHAPLANFTETNKKGVIKNADLISLLDKTKMNYVIIDSEKNNVFLSATNLLLSELSNYSIQLVVLETALIPNSENISSKRFKILNMLYPSIKQAPTKIKTVDYLEKYKEFYNSEASENVLFGFDITFDTLLRISQEISFEESAIKDKTAYLTLKFDYKKNELGGYHNDEIFIFQYNENAPIIKND